MKYKTTRKAVMRGTTSVIEVGYGQLQSLLSHREPEAYTEGVYGWNADIYRSGCGEVVICTGYRPFGNYHPSYELVRKYEKQAEELRNRKYPLYDIDYRLDCILAEFVYEALMS